MEFRIEEVYEKKDFAGLIRAAQYQRAGRRPKILRILKALLGIWTLWAGLWGLWQTLGNYEALGGGSVLPMVMPGVLLSACGAALLTSAAGKGSRGAAIAWKQYPDKGKKLIYVLTDQDVSCISPGSELHFEYDLIQSVLEDQERFYLFMNKHSAHILKKASFQQGDPGDFSAFISEKTGEPVKYIQ